MNHQRMREGLMAAWARAVEFGRPPRQTTTDFEVGRTATV